MDEHYSGAPCPACGGSGRQSRSAKPTGLIEIACALALFLLLWESWTFYVEWRWGAPPWPEYHAEKTFGRLMMAIAFAALGVAAAIQAMRARLRQWLRL